MTTITFDVVATPPDDEPDPDGWTRGYVAGVLRGAGVVVGFPGADEPDGPDMSGLDIGPQMRAALADAAQLATQMDESCPIDGCGASFTNGQGRAAHMRSHDDRADVECPWCTRTFRAVGLAVHKARCPKRPDLVHGPPVTIPEPRSVPELVGADDREARHAARRAAAADAT